MTNEHFTAEEKYKAAKREVNFRKYVYPRRIEAGSISKENAAKQIAIMEAIAADYAELMEKERLL